MSRRNAIGLVLIVFLLLYAILYQAAMDSKATGTQANHQLALAQGFTENGFDFAHPEQQTFNHASDDWQSVSKTTITAEHFPIHSYIPAVVAQLFSFDLVKTFRWYVLLFGFVGLYYLYLLGLLLTNHVGKSLFLVVFTASTPLFAQFQGDLTALIPSISLAFVGIYLYFQGAALLSTKHLLGSLCFLVMASLSAPLLLTVLGVVLIPILKKLKQSNIPKSRLWVIVGCLLLPIPLDYLHFLLIQTEFGANTPFLIENWPIKSNNKTSIYWDGFSTYLSLVHLIVLMLLFALFGWKNRKGIFNKTPQNKTVLAFAVQSILGVIVFSIIMPTRFLNDPAFILEIGCIPLTFLILFLLQNTQWHFWESQWKWTAPLFILVLFVLMSEGNRAQFVRQKKHALNQQSEFDFNFLGSGETLTILGIPKDAKVAVLIDPFFDYSQAYFLQLQRKGCIINTVDLNYEALKACDYFVINKTATNANLEEINSILGTNTTYETSGLIIGKIE